MKHIVTIFAALIMLQACAGSGSDYKIEGVFPEQISADSVYLYLFPSTEPFNSAAVIDHKFVMTGRIKSPTIAHISLRDKRTVWSFIAESGEIRLNSKSGRAFGTSLNEDFARWNNDIDSIVKACNRDEESIMAALPAYFEEHWAKNKDDVVGTSTLLRSFDILGFDKVKSYYEQIDSKMRDDTIVKMIKQRIDNVEKTSVGRKAPDATLHSVGGDKVSLLSLLERNKYSLVNCWASWRKPCLDAFPKIKEVASKYPELNVIGIAINDNPNKTVETMVSEGITWDVVFAPRGSFVKEYNIISLPAFILINGEGVIVERYFDIDELEARVAKHLGER